MWQRLPLAYSDLEIYFSKFSGNGEVCDHNGSHIGYFGIIDLDFGHDNDGSASEKGVEKLVQSKGNIMPGHVR